MENKRLIAELLCYRIADKLMNMLGESIITENTNDPSKVDYRVLLMPVAHLGSGNTLPSIDYSEITNDPAYIKYLNDETGNIDQPSYHAYLYVSCEPSKRDDAFEIDVGLCNGDTKYVHVVNKVDIDKLDFDKVSGACVSGYLKSYKDGADKDRGSGLYVLMRG